jgi:hypothetical protein
MGTSRFTLSYAQWGKTKNVLLERKEHPGPSWLRLALGDTLS